MATNLENPEQVIRTIRSSRASSPASSVSGTKSLKRTTTDAEHQPSTRPPKRTRSTNIPNGNSRTTPTTKRKTPKKAAPEASYAQSSCASSTEEKEKEKPEVPKRKKRTPRKSEQKFTKPRSETGIHTEASDEEEKNLNISRAERDDLVFELTHEKARRLAEAVNIPEDSNLGEDEQKLFLDLATRGCKPLMSAHWRRDFSTLPDWLFTRDDNEDNKGSPDKEDDDDGGVSDDEQLVFKSHRGSDFGAIKALQRLLATGGHVRDCQVLAAPPQRVIQRAIQRYMRWVLNDAGLKTDSPVIPVHAVYAQKKGESTLAAITRMNFRLETLAKRHQTALSRAAEVESKSISWPTLIGFVLCGPIVALVSLDTDPGSLGWREDASVKVKYLGQFDLSETAQDVWNSVAIAISVVHIRRIMLRMAGVHEGRFVPMFRGWDERDDEDI
ncbi:hypothetical protein N7474_000536 [Penicillium riverlandense]|uniref:uncharacterized protein n=1 Tax=Penicillium riverlandense TaxID=1903569 RepID=UPI00254872F9|nr:uncharacterized protein N7474_000536 [Penicillium riverlandense]KAJ5832225.1 hypothetical protein N7474_000536 [Penicillium riverlandense]